MSADPSSNKTNIVTANVAGNGAQEDERPKTHRKYESKGKHESIEEIKDEDKTKLNHAYNIWVMMKQNKPGQQD